MAKPAAATLIESLAHQIRPVHAIGDWQSKAFTQPDQWHAIGQVEIARVDTVCMRWVLEPVGQSPCVAQVQSHAALLIPVAPQSTCLSDYLRNGFV